MRCHAPCDRKHDSQQQYKIDLDQNSYQTIDDYRLLCTVLLGRKGTMSRIRMLEPGSLQISFSVPIF